MSPILGHVILYGFPHVYEASLDLRSEVFLQSTVLKSALLQLLHPLVEDVTDITDKISEMLNTEDGAWALATDIMYFLALIWVLFWM